MRNLKSFTNIDEVGPAIKVSFRLRSAALVEFLVLSVEKHVGQLFFKEAEFLIEILNLQHSTLFLLAQPGPVLTLCTLNPDLIAVDGWVEVQQVVKA